MISFLSFLFFSILKERRYVCFDGDVDALWIENMNSVMDDNRLLTLANGERIRLENYCALLFEVSGLRNHRKPLFSNKTVHTSRRETQFNTHTRYYYIIIIFISYYH